MFFCGAGVSKPAGLPSFRALASHILTDLLPDKKNCEPASMAALAWQAFGNNRFDEALGILESRKLGGFEPKLIREQVRYRLSLPRINTAEQHLTLAQLADLDTNQGRLVTTNFDHLFETAQQTLRDLEGSSHQMAIHVAPALPPAKPQTFRGLAYLHGKLRTSADDRQLILTTADFGVAYMLEGWALRFSRELFRHYHVVFIGYRVEDPTMRYLVSALAATRTDSPLEFKEPYAFVAYGDSEEATTAEQAKQQWLLKGITPLPYDSGNAHEQLWRTLQAWAKDHRQGIAGRRQKVVLLSQTPPTDANDPAVGEMVWALKDLEVARYFANRKSKSILNPGWILPLEESGLLTLATSLTNGNESVKVPLVSRCLADYINPNDVSIELGRWIFSSLDSKEVLDWTLSRGAVLHTQLRQEIRNQLENDRLQIRTAFRKVWRVLANDGYAYALAEKHHRADSGYHERIRLAPDAAYDVRCFLDALRPIPVFKASAGHPWFAREPDPELPSDWCEIEIELVGFGYDHEVERVLERAEDREGALAPIADEFTTLVREAMDWLRTLDMASPYEDATYSRYPSISPHEQNKYAHTWTQLIKLARESYDALITTGRFDAATRLAGRWQSLPYPVFRRLALYAATGGQDA